MSCGDSTSSSSPPTMSITSILSVLVSGAAVALVLLAVPRLMNLVIFPELANFGIKGSFLAFLFLTRNIFLGGP